MFQSKTFINLLTPIVRNIRRMGLLPAKPLINDRAIEYGFMAQEINLEKGMRILDVGFLESPTAFILTGLGAETYALDLRKSPIEYPGMKTIVGDIRKLDFPDNFFDRIVAISTIEHLGIPTRYDSYRDIDADRKALLEMGRLLRDDGIIIITMPFGKSNIDSVQRTYDSKDIKKLTEGFLIKKIEYAKNNGSFWNKATFEEVENTVGYHANVLISLQKIK